MKRIILILGMIAWVMAIIAQRYTGYGRGTDWGGGFGSGGFDYFIPAILVILLIAYGVITIVDKIKKYINGQANEEDINSNGKNENDIDEFKIQREYQEKDINPLTLNNTEVCKKVINQSPKAKVENTEENPKKTIMIPLLDFITTYGKLSLTDCTNNDTGDIDRLGMFTDVLGHKTFAAFSSLLGNLTMNEINAQKEKLYIYKEKEGCYFFCTIESEKERKDPNTDSCYQMFEDALESLLQVLNVGPRLDSFSFSPVEETIQDVLDTLYNGEYEYEINYLTIEQKMALFTLLTFLAETAAFDGDKDDIANTVRRFAHTLHLYEEKIDSSNFGQITSNKKKCIEIAKTIHRDGPLIEFAIACWFLQNEEDSNPMFTYECIHTFMDIGFSKEEAEGMYKGKYTYKFK